MRIMIRFTMHERYKEEMILLLKTFMEIIGGMGNPDRR